MTGRRAFVDESHVAATAHYLLAAVIVSEASAEALSAATAPVRRRGRAPFHWYHELDVSRTAMIHHIAASSDLQVVVISRPVAPGRHERARARCMESLLAQLQSLDPPVRHVVFESRTQVLDKRDAARIEGMRSSLRFLPVLRFSSETKEQPLLWLADAVAGAESAHIQGDSRYVDLLEERLIRVRIPGVL